MSKSFEEIKQAIEKELARYKKEPQNFKPYALSMQEIGKWLEQKASK